MVGGSQMERSVAEIDRIARDIDMPMKLGVK